LGELPADHRGGREDRLLALCQAVDPGGQHRLHTGRHRDLLDRAGQPVGAALAHQASLLKLRLDDLLDKEWVAFAALPDQLCEPVEGGI
jgi:hypothetical protein